jgi:hypothetical protein
MILYEPPDGGIRDVYIDAFAGEAVGNEFSAEWQDTTSHPLSHRDEGVPGNLIWNEMPTPAMCGAPPT